MNQRSKSLTSVCCITKFSNRQKNFHKTNSLHAGEGERTVRKRRKNLFSLFLPKTVEFDKRDVHPHRMKGCADVNFPLSLTSAVDSMEQP